MTPESVSAGLAVVVKSRVRGRTFQAEGTTGHFQSNDFQDDLGFSRTSPNLHWGSPLLAAKLFEVRPSVMLTVVFSALQKNSVHTFSTLT